MKVSKLMKQRWGFYDYVRELIHDGIEKCKDSPQKLSVGDVITFPDFSVDHGCLELEFERTVERICGIITNISFRNDFYGSHGIVTVSYVDHDIMDNLNGERHNILNEYYWSFIRKDKSRIIEGNDLNAVCTYDNRKLNHILFNAEWHHIDPSYFDRHETFTLLWQPVDDIWKYHS